MSESTGMKPTARVLPHELPASLREAGLTNRLGEKVIMACLLHDIAIAGLLSANHGYWGLWSPRMSMRKSPGHRETRSAALYSDRSVGYSYPQAYIDYFGPTTPRPVHPPGTWGRAQAPLVNDLAPQPTINDIYSFTHPAFSFGGQA